jgi:Restriction endonuclease
LAISQGLISPGGLTPEASLNAAITQEIKRRDAANRDQRFRAHGRGMYGLAQPSDPLGGAIDRKNAEVRARLRSVLSDLDPLLFESLIGQLLTVLGFEDVEVTKYSNDGGIDLRATLAVGGVTDVRTAIQVRGRFTTVGACGRRSVRSRDGGTLPAGRRGARSGRYQQRYHHGQAREPAQQPQSHLRPPSVDPQSRSR